MHDMDALHPGTLCGSVLDARRPVSAIPGAPRGPKGAPKMRIVTFWPFRPPKRPRGRSSSKHKSYLRYLRSLWRQNQDFKFSRFGSRTFACCADWKIASVDFRGYYLGQIGILSRRDIQLQYINSRGNFMQYIPNTNILQYILLYIL